MKWERVLEWEKHRLMRKEMRRNPDQCFQLAVVTLGAICIMLAYKANDRSR